MCYTEYCNIYLLIQYLFYIAFSTTFDQTTELIDLKLFTITCTNTELKRFLTIHVCSFDSFVSAIVP